MGETTLRNGSSPAGQHRLRVGDALQGVARQTAVEAVGLARASQVARQQVRVECVWARCERQPRCHHVEHRARRALAHHVLDAGDPERVAGVHVAVNDRGVGAQHRHAVGGELATHR